MVNTRNAGDEAAFNAVVAEFVEALMPDLRTRLFDEYRQAHLGAGSSGDAAPTILGCLEKFGKQKPKSFSSTNSPVDAENWIAHIEKIFEVLGCADEFKARLATYKLEADALSWWKSYKQVKGDDFVTTLTWQSFREIFYLQYFPRSEQQKFEREYHNIKQFDNESSGDFMRRFLRLASFLGTRAGNQEEQAMKFKWALTRNVEILRERTMSNKRNRDGDRIQSSGATGSGQNNNQKYGNSRGQQYGNSSGYRSNYGSGSSNQKRFLDQASSPPCSTCRKMHPGNPCHRLTGGCLSCGVVGHRASDCPKNKNKGGTGTHSAASGRVFAMTREQAARASANECPKNKNKGGTGTQSAASGRVFAMTREQAARASELGGG
ncbi:zinc finger, CCHC-type, Retrotransposon gag domain protein [Artemisia annua]|uniref:Zinc finger, CCHC-type, Retrotransposon gag domain protein n=1 Tax=Artemisia annua TaxID=35608 RepID=A0A2U1L1F2_ARTAN|nr:zinc finger, CCHC-type, Retrotransposon gag domain protein [Artemisia annua]